MTCSYVLSVKVKLKFLWDTTVHSTDEYWLVSGAVCIMFPQSKLVFKFTFFLICTFVFVLFFKCTLWIFSTCAQRSHWVLSTQSQSQRRRNLFGKNKRIELSQVQSAAFSTVQNQEVSTRCTNALMIDILSSIIIKKRCHSYLTKANSKNESRHALNQHSMFRGLLIGQKCEWLREATLKS